MVKVDTAVHRCALIGLDLPTEPTVGHIVSVIVSLAQCSLEAVQMHSLVVEFKKKLKAKCKLHGFSGEHGLVEFPASPHGLPKSRWDSAYGDTKPTEFWQTHTLSMQSQPVPLRSTASSLKTVPTMSHTVHHPDLQSIVGQVIQGFCQMLPKQAQMPITFLTPQTKPQQALSDSPSPSHQIPAAPVQTEHAAGGSRLRPFEFGSKPSPLALPPIPEYTAEDQSATVLKALETRVAAKKEAKEKEAEERALEEEAKGKDLKVKGKTKKIASGEKSNSNTKPKVSKPVSGKSASSKSPAVKKTAMKSEPKATKPPMPGSGAKTTYYLGGKIHRSDLKEAWRVFINKTDRVDKALIRLKRLVCIKRLSLSCCSWVRSGYKSNR